MTREIIPLHDQIQNCRMPADSEVTDAVGYLGRNLTSYQDSNDDIDRAVRVCSKAFQRLGNYQEGTQEDLRSLQELVKHQGQISNGLTEEQQAKLAKISSIFATGKKPYPVSQPIPIHSPLRRHSLSQHSPGSFGFVVIKAETPTRSSNFPHVKAGRYPQRQPTLWNHLCSMVNW